LLNYDLYNKYYVSINNCLIHNATSDLDFALSLDESSFVFHERLYKPLYSILLANNIYRDDFCRLRLDSIWLGNVPSVDFCKFLLTKAHMFKKNKNFNYLRYRFKDVEYFDYNASFPNPLHEILKDNYMKNMILLLEKGEAEYQNTPVETYYVVLPLAYIIEVKNTMMDVQDKAKEIREKEKKAKIMKILSFVFMGISFIAMPFGTAVNLLVGVVDVVVLTVAGYKLTGQIDGFSLATGIVGILTPFLETPSTPALNIFRNIDLNDIKGLGKNFSKTKKFEELVAKKICKL